MKRFTLYYKTENGDRIALYSYDDYNIAVSAWRMSTELNAIPEKGNALEWHLIDNKEETVLF